MKNSLIILLLALNVFSIKGQGTQIRSGNPMDIGKYFEGTWKGEGTFANGKAINAIATFNFSLDSCWLICTHTDQLPNKYKAISMWSTDRQKNDFPVVIFDNSHSNRDFMGTHVHDNEVILVYKNDKTTVQYYERFVYLILDHNRFKMTYELSRNAIDWQQGDFLVFARQ